MSPGDRMSKGLDFMLKDIGPKDKPSKAEGTLQEFGLESQDKNVQLQDPSIFSQESGVKIPESGITAPEEKDAKQESSIRLPESRVMTPESAAQLQETRPRSQEEMKKSRNETQESRVVTDDIIDQAVAQALKSPKISLYSPLLLAVLESQQLMLLNHKELTLLQYRKATKARELVENALRESYPELCEKILKRMNEGNEK